jgi:4-amino-4-deoxy-L-arabinose transferase-like glycosyltransferase
VTLTVGRPTALEAGPIPKTIPARARSAPGLVRVSTRLPLMAIAGVAALVRLVNLDAHGFNSDEAVYAGQAASLAGNPIYTDSFPVFRAHPMLVQALLSVVYRSGEHDTAGRVIVALLGVATVGLVYLLGRELYDHRVGLVAASLVAVMPYHVVVTRQVLLDGPMVFFATLTLLCVARFARTQQLAWFLAAGGAMGLTVLAKESALVLCGGVYAFLALSPSIRRPILGSLAALGVVFGLFLVHPVTQALAGHASTAKSYLVWQLLRRPNHGFEFYAVAVPWAVGPLVLLAAAYMLWRAQRRGQAWREVLLGSWIFVPVLFFTLWPVKGFQYLLPTVPALAVLAARAVFELPKRLKLWKPAGRYARPRGIALRTGALVVMLASLLMTLVPQLVASGGTSLLAGTGGMPGGREAGSWIRTHTPAGATVMTLGPSMANIVQYYGHREAYGLSVSNNPLHRNPSYQPIQNPDRAMRQGDLQYVVWDSVSAARSPYFEERLQVLTRRYHGRVVHTEYVTAPDAEGRDTKVPVIVVYEVRP